MKRREFITLLGGRPASRTADEHRVLDQSQNRESARISIPDSVLARADRVIE
jgi:hypothetical protein